MKTPKEIYLLQKGSQLLGTWSGTPQIEISGGWYSAEYKYIRADLVEQQSAEWNEEEKMHLANAILAAEKEWGAESCTAKFLKSLQKEQPIKMIQWTGNNLKEVIDFTGKSPRFGEWFNSWEEFENYVHTHNDILKLFCEDGSHYEVPVGAWIVKTPDGYNLPSVAKYIQQEQPEVDLKEEAYMCGFAQGAKEERERILADIIKMRDTAENRGLNFGAVCGFQIALDELEQMLTGKLARKEESK